MSSTELCRVANRSTRGASDIVSSMQARCVKRTRASHQEASPTTVSRSSEAARIAIGIRKRGHAGDKSSLRRCPSLHTPRCPRSFEVQSMKPASIDSRAGSTTGSRDEGGATPLSSEDVDSILVDVCPLRDVAPPRSSSRTEADGHPHRCGPLVVRLAPTLERTDVLSSVRFHLLRAPRRGRTGATLTPLPRAR
jgi:hypothetical protein